MSSYWAFIPAVENEVLFDKAIWKHPLYSIAILNARLHIAHINNVALDPCADIFHSLTILLNDVDAVRANFVSIIGIIHEEHCYIF